MYFFSDSVNHHQIQELFSYYLTYNSGLNLLFIESGTALSWIKSLLGNSSFKISPNFFSVKYSGNIIPCHIIGVFRATIYSTPF